MFLFYGSGQSGSTMPLLPYKTVILDFDGVLVESNAIKQQAFEALFSKCPEHLAAILDYHQKNAVIRFQKFRYIYEHILKRPYTPQDEAALGRDFSAFCIESVIKCPEVKGAGKFLEDFYRRVPLYLVSINPEVDLTQILEARGLAQFFKKVYAVEGSKAGAIRDVLSRENIQPQEAVFIGDSLGDYQSARQAGIDFIGRRAPESPAFFDVKMFDDMGQILDHLKDKIEVAHA